MNSLACLSRFPWMDPTVPAAAKWQFSSAFVCYLQTPAVCLAALEILSRKDLSFLSVKLCLLFAILSKD